MSEESLSSQDKEELKRRLELLQKEYERTALRLQRAERREAARKHVQKTISEQNQLLHINTSAILEQSCSSSPEQLSSQNVPSDTTKVRFHLPDASPFSTLMCKRSPSRTHRLRSKRSRLRLQNREKESDTEGSQEKTSEGKEERCREERGETESEWESTCEEKEKDVGRRQTEEARKQEEENREKTETLKGGLEENLTAVNLQSGTEDSSVNQSPLMKLLEVNNPPADQSPSTNFKSSDHSNSSNETQSQSCSRSVNAEKSPGSSDFLTSCTLIEGLPFPVEYYIRTTRLMASAHSSVDLYAVIQSQLSNGRGRRRSSRGCVTSQPSSEKPPEKNERKKRGQRGRRGRRRTHESDSSGQSESVLQSPSSLPGEESEPIPSPRPSSEPAPSSQPHLSRELSPDSQLYPIFWKKRGRAAVSRSQITSRVNDSSRLLPSLTSLTQTLRMKDSRNSGGLLTIFDVQDFHLPDDEFGQLKLERLRSSCSNIESFTYSVCFRKNGSANISESGHVEHEKVVLDSLPQIAQVERENADQSEPEITSQTFSTTQDTEDLLHRSITNQAETQHNGEDEKHIQHIKLNLSMSLTSHTQIDHGPSLISLGATPNMLNTSPSPELTHLILSSDQDDSSKRSEEEVNNRTPENQQGEANTDVSVNSNLLIQGPDVSEHTYSRRYTSEVSNMEVKTLEVVDDTLSAEVEIRGCDVSDEKQVVDISTYDSNSGNPKQTNKVLICSETESHHPSVYAFSQNNLPPSQNNPLHSQSNVPHFNNSPLSPNGCPNDPALKVQTPDSHDELMISELDFHSQTLKSLTSHDMGNVLNNQASEVPGVSANQREDSVITSSLNLVGTSLSHTPDSQHTEVLSCGSLQKTHTLKALDGGCVLDVCLVRWPSDDWCVCVAGEWSVCVWKQKAGVQLWSLLYTWTFTQSVISLQGIPESSALLCVCLGRLEITEARILYCPSTDSEFSQAELYKGALQSVLAVSDRRVTCCSAPGPQQRVQVFTLMQDGRIAETLSLVSTYQTIQTLVVVEKEKDALIGWTEHKSLLIWNMISGQLLQTIRLAESVSTATCLRGYSYRGALCVLLQQASVCHEGTGSTLFTLIATNPLTGKSFTLSSITTPSVPTERLIDGDVCESALVGVFQSGLAIWNLTEGVACVYGKESAGVCRLARWAGPNTLLTGYLNGDVNIYQFKPRENRTELKDS